MSIALSLLAEFKVQAPGPRRFIEFLPEDKLTWKPHQKSMTAGGVGLPSRLRARRGHPEASAALGGPGISRFPREMSAYVHGVSDRAGLWHTSRYRRSGWSLLFSPAASAPRSEFPARLHTWPARSPVNASTLPCKQLRMTRNRCGSLIHFRMIFAFTTPRRFSRRTGE